MGDFNQIPTAAINPLISGETKKRGGLDFRVYQDLKTGIHRDLLNKIDLGESRDAFATTAPDARCSL